MNIGNCLLDNVFVCVCVLCVHVLLYYVHVPTQLFVNRTKYRTNFLNGHSCVVDGISYCL